MNKRWVRLILNHNIKKEISVLLFVHTIIIVLSSYNKHWPTIKNSDGFDEWRFDLSLC